jgi:hypothetical protein
MHKHHSRPVQVAIIASFLVFFSLVGLVGAYLGLRQVQEHQDRLGGMVSLIFSLLGIACGTFMLVGANWARLVYFAGYLPFFAWVVLTVAPERIVGFIFTALCSLLLLTPGSNRFFLGRDTLFPHSHKVLEESEGVSENSPEKRHRTRRGRYDY